MKTPTFTLTAILLFCAGCNKDRAVAEPDAQEQKTPAPPEELAKPSEIPEGLESLKLTKDQAARINQWLEQQGEKVDPSDFAKQIQSVIRDDQQAAFRKIIESAGG